MNDISRNPAAKKTAIEAKFRIRMIKFELWLIDRTQFIWLKSLYTSFIKPIFAIVSISFKYLFMIPVGRIIAKIFPKFAEKVRKESADS